MKDGIIKGTGDSRYLKSVADFLTRYPDYESFAQALITGTMPIDLNGINPQGWAQQGDLLNKGTLLSDATAEAMGLTGNPTTDSAIRALDQRLSPTEEKASAALLITGGSMAGTLSDESAAQVRNITLSTTDLEAGESPLPTGSVYLVYE